MKRLKMPLCESEINNLVDLKEDDPPTDPERRKKLVAREALQEWTESVEELEGKVWRGKKSVDALTNEIYQLVGLYAGFVSLPVYTYVQTDRVQCRHIWSPIVLCLLAWFVIDRVVDHKFIAIDELIRYEITLNDRDRKRFLSNLRRMKVFGHEKFDFTQHALEYKSIPKDEKHHSNVHRWNVRIIILILMVVLVGSIIQILCFDDSFEVSVAYYENPIPPT